MTGTLSIAFEGETVEVSPRREISFDVLGTPAPKGSVRAFYKAGMKRAVVVKDNSERQRSWDASVRDQALLVVGDRAEPVFVNTPLSIEIEFRLARPSGHWSTKPGGGLKPSAPRFPAVSRFDWDKLSRSTCDALKGVLYDDDGRIVDAIVRKRYAQPGREGARITIREAT